MQASQALKSKVAIPKSAAASLEAMINYQLPDGSPSNSLGGGGSFGVHNHGSFGAIGMGDAKMGAFGGAMGQNLGSLVPLGSMMTLGSQPSLPALRECGEEEEEDPAALLITGLPRFLF